MKIMTWNVNRFNGTWDWSHNGCDIGIKRRKEYAEKIIEKLNNFLIDSDDIAILQEVPYIDDNWENEWKTEWKDLFDGLSVMFWLEDEPGRNDFNYKKPKNVTVAVTKKDGNWNIRAFDDKGVVKFGQQKNFWNFVNKYIVLENGNFSILGVHITDEKIFDVVCRQSDISYIAGDFNYNSLIKNKDVESKRYSELEKKYKQLIPEDIITENQTIAGIDKIFLKKELSEQYNYSVRVMDYFFVKEKPEYKLRYSDHNLCISEIEKKKLWGCRTK